jgi:hypothetical protein
VDDAGIVESWTAEGGKAGARLMLIRLGGAEGNLEEAT